MLKKMNISRYITVVLLLASVALFFIPFLPYGAVDAGPSKLATGIAGAVGVSEESIEQAKESILPQLQELGIASVVGEHSGLDLMINLFNKQVPMKSSGIIPGVLLILSVILALIGALIGLLPPLARRRRRLMPVFAICAFVTLALSLLNVMTRIGFASSGGLLGKIAGMFKNAAIDWTFSIGLGGLIAGAVLIAAIVLAFIAASLDNKLVSGDEYAVGSIVGIAGMYANASFPIENFEEIVIGRDAAFSHVVIDQGAEKISRKHVSIGYDPNEGMYIVTDFSSNGTYLNNGVRLTQNVAMKLAPGSVIYLAKQENSFRLA